MGALADGCCLPQADANQDHAEIEQLIKTRYDKNKLSISILTWNVGCQLPTDSINTLFKHKNFTADIVVVGLQEVIEINATNMVIDNDAADIAWQNKIQQILNAKHSKNKYSFIEAIDMIGILLLIFAKTPIKDNISNVISRDCATGFLGIGGNKGGVGIRFNIYGTSICFICCHLAAH
eukprot:257407_1